MRVAFYPFKNDNNQFISITQRILRSCGCELFSFDTGFFLSGKCFSTKLAILSWYESLNTKASIIKFYCQWIRKVIPILLCKILGIKIAVYFHNRIPHDSSPNMTERIKRFMCWYFKKADYIIILSKGSKQYLIDYLNQEQIESKVRYIPIPNYIGTYSDPVDVVPYKNHDEFQVLFVGLIRQYKNIELILSAAKAMSSENVMFTIMGQCDDPDYKMKLQTEADTIPNVKLVFGFVEDSIFEQLIREHDVLLLPFDTRSSMNSSTVILAFSNGRSVICPEIATIDEYSIENIYCYKYESREEHESQLLNSIKRAYSDWNSNGDLFRKKGANLLDEVKNKNSVELVKAYYMSMLESVN